MYHVNNFRGAAILLIVLTHCLSVYEVQPEIFRYLDSAIGNDTFYFVAIAGFLFSFTTNDFSYGRFMFGKFKAIILPYLVLSIPAIAIYCLGIKTDHAWMDMDWFSSLNPVFQVGFLYATGAHLGPLWFIPMIITLFALSPLFVLLKDRIGALAIVFLLSVVVGVIVGRPESDKFPELESVYFLPAFLLGMLLAARPGLYRTHAKGAVFVALVLLVFSASLPMLGDASHAFKMRLHLLIELVMSVCLFSLFYAFMNHRTRWLDLFARISFFIFFVHGYFVAVFRLIDSHFLADVPALVTLPVYFAATVLLSVASFVVLKILLRDRSRTLIAA